MTDIDVLFASLPVTRLDAAVNWYSQLFGRPADIVPNDDEVMWRIADAAWLYVIRDEQRAGRSVVTLCVSDLHDALAQIAERGISSGPIEAMGKSAQKAIIADADGNQISFIQVTASS